MLVVLIILYVGTQLASSLLMATPTMDPTQRKIMLALPLVFVLFVIRFPAGVMVYWITTNTWTMAQQYFFKRRIAHRLQSATAAGDLALVRWWRREWRRQRRNGEGSDGRYRVADPERPRKAGGGRGG